MAEHPLSNPRLEKVAQELAKFKSPVEASKAAGYRPGSSFDSNARKRAQHPDVRARIAYLQTVSGVVSAADSAFIQRKLVEIANVPLDSEQVKPSDQIAALGLLAKVIGAIAPTKSEVTGAEGAPLQVIEIVKFARTADTEDTAAA